MIKETIMIETVEKKYHNGLFINFVLKYQNNDYKYNVPNDAGNRHYQEIQKWIADGNTVIDNPPE